MRPAGRHAVSAPTPIEDQPARNKLRFLCNRNGTVHRDVSDSLTRSGGPEDLDGIRAGGVAKADGDRKFGLGEITAGGHDLAHKGVITQPHLDERANSVAVA